MIPVEKKIIVEKVYETSRLLIRRFNPQDLQDAFEILSDPEVAKYEFWDPFDIEETRQDLLLQSSVIPGTIGVWNEFAVQLSSENENAKMIGNISFRMKDAEQKQVEIGFHFNRLYHGQGYGSEAVIGLIEYLWRLGAHRIWAVSDTRNFASWKLMEKIGLRREGHLVQNCFVNGEWCDEYLYAILEPEWRKRHPSM